jgi:protein-S-isoprenylcysteine O-methyltransferase Ste14
MTPPGDNGADKNLGEIVSEVSEKASLLVREEIELAKAEVTAKAKTLARGAGVAVAAGVFLSFAVVTFLHTLAWFINDLLDSSSVWPGFAITTGILFVFAVIAGLLAKRWLSSGPPTPDMAIEEAKITREQLEKFDEVKT